MEIIDELEPVPRGLYGGTVGYFARNGDMDQAITIRTLVFNGDEYSSRPAPASSPTACRAEYDEVLAKSAILRGRWKSRRRAWKVRYAVSAGSGCC
jgi:anthranilate synthase component I